MFYFIINDLSDAFPLVDFTGFSDFELFISTIVVNFFLYFFIYLIISILFRIFVRMR